MERFQSQSSETIDITHGEDMERLRKHNAVQNALAQMLKQDVDANKALLDWIIGGMAKVFGDYVDKHPKAIDIELDDTEALLALLEKLQESDTVH